MKIILRNFIIFFSHTQSIDHETNLTLKILESDEDYSYSQIHSDIPEDMKEFDYKTTSINYISNIKMPYFNCNRRIFCKNIRFYINELLKSENSGFIENLPSKKNDIIGKIFNAVGILDKLDNDKYIKSSDKLYTIIESEKRLIAEIQGFFNILNPRTDILTLKNCAYCLLVELENYIESSSGVDLFMLFFKTKPSILFKDSFEKKYLSFENITTCISSFNYIYKQVYENVCELDKICNVINNGEHHELNASVLKSNLIINWRTDICMKKIINPSDELEHCGITLVYSVNPDNDIIKELTVIAEAICSDESGQKLKSLGLRTAPDQKEMLKATDLIAMNL